MANRENRYAVVVTPGEMEFSRVVWIVGRDRTRHAARTRMRDFISDWRSGRILAMTSDERGAYRPGFTAPKVREGVWDLKSDHSRNYRGTIRVIDTEREARAW